MVSPPDLGVSENSGALFWDPYKKDPAIWGTILGSPIFRNPHSSPFTMFMLWLGSPS